MSKIIVDTNFIISCIINTDSQHELGISLLPLLENNECYISHYIFDEVIAFINRVSDLYDVFRAYSMMINNFIILDDHKIPDFIDEVMGLFWEYEGHLSFTDCTIINLMEYHDIKNIITFDSKFKKYESINVIDKPNINLI